MKLAIDSSSNSAAVALLDGEKVVCDLFLNAGLTHSQTLMPMVEQAVKLVPNCEIDSIAVTVGPGSFTGVRIAVAAAKGLAFVKDIPCFPISTMEALAYNCKDAKGKNLVCTLSDARCKRAYYALFLVENGEVSRICNDDCAEIEKIESIIKSKKDEIDVSDVLLVGDGAKIFVNEYKEYENNLVSSSIMFVKGESVALASKNKNSISANELQPMYLQLPQAQRERMEKLKAQG